MRLTLLRTAALAALLALPMAVPPAAPAFARGAPESFADLAADLQPAVVNISSTQAAQRRGAGLALNESDHKE